MEDRDTQQRSQALGDSQRQCRCVLIVALRKTTLFGSHWCLLGLLIPSLSQGQSFHSVHTEQRVSTSNSSTQDTLGFRMKACNGVWAAGKALRGGKGPFEAIGKKRSPSFSRATHKTHIPYLSQSITELTSVGGPGLFPRQGREERPVTNNPVL